MATLVGVAIGEIIWLLQFASTASLVADPVVVPPINSLDDLKAYCSDVSAEPELFTREGTLYGSLPVPEDEYDGPS